MENKHLTIGHIYPSLLNMYGDKGNILSLAKRLRWRGMTCDVIVYDINEAIDFSALDIVLLGGGGDREQSLALKKLTKQKDALAHYIEEGGVMLALCGAYPMLGQYYYVKNEKKEGLGILNITTERKDDRAIGDAVICTDISGTPQKVVGFENHGGKTLIGDYKPFGTVINGFGNNGTDKTCGVVYKNLIATYLHGPLLPKNPGVADYLLQKALENKYGFGKLLPLDDTVEEEAHRYMVKKLGISN